MKFLDGYLSSGLGSPHILKLGVSIYSYLVGVKPNGVVLSIKVSGDIVSGDIILSSK